MGLSVKTAIFCCALITICSCGSSGSQDAIKEAENEYFASDKLASDPIVFEFIHEPASEMFFASTSDSRVIEAVRAELLVPADQRSLHINGPITPANSDRNAPWLWEFVDSAWTMAEVSMELCDGTPSYVDENLEKWMEEVGSYCPWSSRVLREVSFSEMSVLPLFAGLGEYGQCSEHYPGKRGRPAMLDGHFRLATSIAGNGDLCIDLPSDYIIVNTYCGAHYGPGRNANYQTCLLNQTCQEKGAFRNFRETQDGATKSVCVNFQRGRFAIRPSFFVLGYRP